MKTTFLISILISILLIIALILFTLYQDVPRGSTHFITLGTEYVSIDSDINLAYKMISHQIEDNLTHVTTDVTWQYSKEATIPGPIIQINQWDTISITLENGLDDGCVSLHTHGLSYSIGSDGTLETINGFSDECATIKKSYSYVWWANADTTGTWAYHDHTYCNSLIQENVSTCERFRGVNGAEEMGLYGAIIVNGKSMERIYDDKIINIPTEDIAMDYILYMDSNAQFHGTSINHETNIQTNLGINPTLDAKEGDQVRFSIIGIGNSWHTFHLHSNKWLEPGTTKAIDTRSIGPLETHSFLVTAGGYDGGKGDWQYHCHVFNHMVAGMTGTFKVI